MPQTARAWLSRQAPELVVRLQASASEDVDCDLLIVGSGYGAAVAAARAAGQRKPDGTPARVWVLERGSEYLPGTFPSRFSEIAGHVRFDMQDGAPARGQAQGLFDARLGKDVCVLLGNGLGGGSLINAGVMERPADDVFDKQWPKAITRQEWDDAYRQALTMLAPQPVPRDKECSKLHVLDSLFAPKQADRCAVTVHWQDERNAAGVQMRACTLCGDCFTGCNQSAKGSLDANYLAFARARGVEMFCGGTVQTLARDDRGFWHVHWRYTDRKLQLPDDSPFVVRAQRVVLAAGSLGSTEILLRSQTDALQFSKELGRNFSANGDKVTAGARHAQRVNAVGDQETDPADGESLRRVGPTITGLIRVPATLDKVGFAVEEFAVPAGLRHVYGEIVALLAALGEDQIGSADAYAVTDKDIEHISLYGSMGDDGADGKIVLPASGAEGVRIDWQLLRFHRLYARMGSWFKEHLGAAVAVPNPLAESTGADMLRLLPAFTVHPLGGCRMADDIDNGVVDHCGRVFDPTGATYEGLYVLDGSIVPRALGINPALTITALAERAMPQLVRDWAWQADSGRVSVVPPRPHGARRELPARDVVWSIRERVQGLFSIDQQTFFWARMEIEFEEVPGFRRALALTSRMLTVRRATLALYDGAKADTDEFSVADPDTDEPAFRATLAGSMELFAAVPDAPPGDERTRLVYRLGVQSVQDVQGRGGSPLAVGGRLEGVKVFGKDIGAARDTSPWRQLSEMRMRYDGKPVGRWALDLADLAQRRDPLLRVMRLSSMPDAIEDAAAVVLYVLRRALNRLLGYWPEFESLQPSAQGLSERWPVASKTDVTRLPGGARLTHYPAVEPAALPPVMLIHGLGSSGASYTDEALTNGLEKTLCKSGRDVWVLDVRSSVGNEFARDADAFEDTRRWTVDSVAQADLPEAIDTILALTDKPQVDVFAHCMGAVMFCLAALGSDRMKGKVRAAVLSQVGPLIRFSPMNRFRGYVASYLQQFLRIDTLDTAPDFKATIVGGEVQWDPRPEDDIAAKLFQLIVDLLLFTFPYPDDDKEAERQHSGHLKQSDFRRVRHRGDAIFGQLFELKNVSDAALLRLQAFMGWVMVPMLAQAIHFARRNMLTDATGRNAVLHQANFKERFDFPVLMVHGRRNRVFDWRGSHDSWQLLKDLRQDSAVPDELQPTSTRYGKGTRTQLTVLHDYGHLDCIIGEHAHEQVFPFVEAFYNEAHTLPDKGPAEVGDQFEAPWIGPTLGWLQPMGDAQDKLWNIKVLVHPALRGASTRAVVVMPMSDEGGALVPRVDQARVIALHQPADRPAPRHFLLDLHIAEFALQEHFDRFSVLTVHDDGLSLQAQGEDRQITWSPDGDEANPGIQSALRSWTSDPCNQAALAASIFTLAAKLGNAADQGKAADKPPQRLTFALASCQYPPGLFDQRPAAAAYERLHADAIAADGPQFLLLCGDQVYVDETAGAFDPIAAPSGPIAVRDAAIDRSYELTWRLPPMRRSVARLPVVTMLDDHEVEDNWKGLNAEAEPRRDEVARALAAYARHQALLNPQRPLAQGDTVGGSIVNYPGGVPLFVLDTRTRRVLRDAPNVTTAGIVPDAVMQRLCEQLCAAPRSCVKLIVSPSPMLPPERFDPAHPAERLRSDSWSGYPASVVTLLGFVRDEDIRRVVFLSGDAHLSSVCSLAFCGKHGPNRVVSVVSSGLYTPWPFANQRPDELQLEGAVNLGWTQRPFDGTLKLHAQSAHNGHAVVSLDQVNGQAMLHVSLRAANGATTDCRIALT